MPLSFSPDWISAGTDTVNAEVFTINLLGPSGFGGPAGDAGDTIVVFMVSDVNDLSNTPVLTDAWFYGAGAVNLGALTVRSQVLGSLDQRIITLTGTRPADMEGIQLIFDTSKGAGDSVFAIGNFPASALPEVRVEENWPYGERLTEQVSASGSGVFAGMMFSDTNPGVGVTAAGSGGFDDVYVASVTDDYDMVAWAYEGSGATFDLTGNWIHYAVLLGPRGFRFYVGTTGFSV